MLAEAAPRRRMTEVMQMDPIRLRMTVAALGAVALATTALVVGDGPDAPPAAGEGRLVERVTAALDAPTAAAPAAPAAAGAIIATARPGGADETAAAIATATRAALAAIGEGAAAGDPPDATAQADASGFRRVDDEAPDFVISAADAWIAADQGWVAASGVAPATIEPRPLPRRD